VSPFERWRFALKPASWPKLLVPFALGQAIGFDATGHLSWLGLALALALTAADAVFVVALNDWGDRDVDRIKRRMFPQTSKKTIADGVLPAATLLLAGTIAGFVALGVATTATFTLDRPLAIPGTLVALGLFVAYTLPPLRLNYRGGGELLEALGVGIVLPWLSAYLQSGRAWMPALDALPGFAVLALASAVASGLSDERSDREGGKRTLVTMLGNTLSRRLVMGLVALAPLVWIAAAMIPSGTPTITLVVAAAMQAFAWPNLARASAPAETDAFDAQSRFKAVLHRSVWESALTLAGFLAFAPWIGL
jgi:1,4-dihydroxy-2-naphthoate octaprenyltransferase